MNPLRITPLRIDLTVNQQIVNQWTVNQWTGAWILVGLLLGSLLSCTEAMDSGSEPSEPDPARIGRVESYQGEDGTQFVADPEGCGALPSGFPHYLLIPGSEVLSSGVVADEAGSMQAVRLLTRADDATLAHHYRDQLWYGRWDLLSETTDGDFVVWVLEDTHPDPERFGRQVMIQVGPPKAETREILVMLTQGQPQDPVLTVAPQCAG